MHPETEHMNHHLRQLLHSALYLHLELHRGTQVMLRYGVRDDASLLLQATQAREPSREVSRPGSSLNGWLTVSLNPPQPACFACCGSTVSSWARRGERPTSTTATARCPPPCPPPCLPPCLAPCAPPSPSPSLTLRPSLRPSLQMRPSPPPKLRSPRPLPLLRRRPTAAATPHVRGSAVVSRSRAPV